MTMMTMMTTHKKFFEVFEVSKISKVFKDFYSNFYSHLLRLLLGMGMTLCYLQLLYAWAPTPEMIVRQFPTAPENCFAERSYCAKTSIVYEGSTRYIQVVLFASIDASNYPTTASLMDRYFDFDHWSVFLQGKESIKPIRSKGLPVTYENGHPVYTHLHHYYSEAPFPIWTLEVKELSIYRPMIPSQMQDAEITYEFDLIKGRHVIPELNEDFTDAVGVKNKYGRMFLKLDPEAQKYLVYVVTQTTPQIDLLPSIAAPYIEKSVTTIFEGVFDL
ncbi:MAG: hypothetical protein HQK53_03295 [Oligoflexia bacterium]|nr:hypothetical protein [Oligoflexia bacterium]